MDKLLQPDFGLTVWTIVTFLLLVFILKKFAWGPMLHAIEEREHRMKADLDGARKARTEAERIKGQIESEMAGLQSKSRELLLQAQKDAEVLGARLKAVAEEDAARIRTKTMTDLDEEKQRLVRELRHEVAGLSVLAAERLLRKSVDDGVQKTVLDGFFKDLDAKKVKN